MKGRGALSNPAGRYARQVRVRDPAPPQERVATEVTTESTRSLISRNQSPDIPFNLSVNPYRGCEHGCIYCFARPDHARLDLSPGLDFETRIVAKPDAPAVLERELRRRSYRCEVIALGASTDAYQPAEKRFGITRRILQVAVRFGQPISLVTKSSLVLRDLDLLSALAQRNLASVMVSVTSLDSSIKRTLEPRAAGPATRLAVISRLAEAGVPVGVMVAPVIPKITDHELESILEAARDAGATMAGYILLRLPGEVRPLFEQWLASHYPLRQQAVLNLLRECHDGEVYRARWGERMRGTGPYSELLRARFRRLCRRLDLQRRAQLSTDAFAPPPREGDQLSLFS